MEQVKSRFIKGILIFAMVFTFQAFSPQGARAQSGIETTRISIGAPAQANLGDHLTVNALLVNDHGNPIAKATIFFTTRAEFLNKSGDVVLAQAVTNKDGLATVHFGDDFSGAITLNAEFRGDAQYVPSNATAQVNAANKGQVYTEHIGVGIPGFTVPPMTAGPMASLESQSIQHAINNLWPAMNGWPIAAALIIVWSLYFRAAMLIYRIAKPGRDAAETRPTGIRRSI